MRPDTEAGQPRPGRYLAGVRGRRLGLVLSLVPGAVLTMVLAPAAQSPALLLAGSVLTALAILGWGAARRFWPGRAPPLSPDDPEIS